MDFKQIENFFTQKSQRLIVAIFIGFSLLITWVMDRPKDKSNKPQASVRTHEAVDTYIPSGFVLVPITVQNLASLDSLVGQFGVVDLYVEGENAALGRGLKLIRSPNDPAQFAVLVPENQAREIVRAGYKPFQVIVQNPKQTRSEIRQPLTTPKRIIWEN